MSKAIIKIDKLKPEALKLTDRKQFGMDEYVYIKSFNYDDNNAIKVRFYVLLKINETDFNMLDDIKYSIADGKPFLDINGHPVYKKDENGDLIEEDSDYIKRLDDYTRNFTAFLPMLEPSILNDIKNFLGYHENENGFLDI